MFFLCYIGFVGCVNDIQQYLLWKVEEAKCIIWSGECYGSQSLVHARHSSREGAGRRMGKLGLRLQIGVGWVGRGLVAAYVLKVVRCLDSVVVLLTQ